MLDSSCESELEKNAMLLPKCGLYVLAAANEQLLVLDNRLSPDFLADGFRQLNDSMWRKNQLRLRATDGARQRLRVHHVKTMLFSRIVQLVTEDIIVECLATAKCRNGLQLSKLRIWLCVGR